MPKKLVIQQAIGKRKKDLADALMPSNEYLPNAKDSEINDKLREQRVKRFARRGVMVTNPDPLKGVS